MIQNLFKGVYRRRSIILFTFFFVSVFSLAGSYGFLIHQIRAQNEVVTEIYTFAQDTYFEQQIVKAKVSQQAYQYSTSTIPVLVYHIVRSKNPSATGASKHKLSDKFSVDEDVFDAQMNLLKEEGYVPLTIRDALRRKASSTLPLQPVVITFDDGWRSQYDIALPILKRYNFPATFYIYTGVIGSPLFMTWQDLEDLLNQHMEIGGHTKHHPRLTKINPRRYKEELLESKQTLEKRLHISVTDFAYPYGEYNDQVIKELKTYGYTSGRTSKKGITGSFDDPYQIEVLYVPNSLIGLERMLHLKN
jgi:peptidoglycan/xylan/chitin deacetylase (PgdA/CDA1 family)